MSTSEPHPVRKANPRLFERGRQLLFLTLRRPEKARPLTQDHADVDALADALRDATDRLATMFGPTVHGSDEITVHLYGPNAEALLAMVTPVLRASPLVGAAWALLRYGDVGAVEVQRTVVPSDGFV